jgi:glutathione synthase/RimK-type ligase-like ATP-grasp enzyme
MSYIKSLQEKDLDVIVKSIISQKHFLCQIGRNESPYELIGDMAYSFIDRDECLLIQEYKPMTYERRFFVVNREVVTHSPVANHLTPLDLISDDDVINQHYYSPNNQDYYYDNKTTEQFLEVAQDITQKMDDPHATFDLSLTKEGVTIIEFNPLKIGMIGLFAMDPRKIAESSKDVINDIKHEIKSINSVKL